MHDLKKCMQCLHLFLALLLLLLQVKLAGLFGHQRLLGTPWLCSSDENSLLLPHLQLSFAVIGGYEQIEQPL